MSDQPGGTIVAEYTRPVPIITDQYSRQYFEAWADQRLLVQRCTDCGHWQHYPRALCVECGGDPEFVEQAATGTVYTYTVIRQMGVEPFKTEAPYAVVMVELDCGVKIMGSITDCQTDDVHIGMAVDGYGVLAGDGIGVPFWRPRQEN